MTEEDGSVSDAKMGSTVSDVVTVLPPTAAVMVDKAFEVTELVDTENVAEL